MNLYWQGQTGPEILMKAGVCQIEWLKQKVRAKEFHAWLLWSMVYIHDLHAPMITCIPIYPHGISRNICTPKEAAWGRCGWYCSHVWPCSLASRWIRQTWRRRGQKKQGWHLAFKSVDFVSSIFMIFHLSQQNASHRVYSQNGQKMLEVNMTFPPLLVEKIGCRDCSAFVLCVSPPFASLKSCRRIQVESASWRGPEDHAGRVQVQAVPPQQSAPIEDQRGSYFVHKSASDTALWYRYTSAFATCNRFTTGFKRLMRSNSRYF